MVQGCLLARLLAPAQMAAQMAAQLPRWLPAQAGLAKRPSSARPWASPGPVQRGINGSRACTCVPAPGAVSMCSWPPSACTR